MDDRGIKSDGFGARGSTCGTIERSLSGSRQGERAFQPLAIRQACLVPLALSAPSHESMVNGCAAASGEQETDLSEEIFRFGDILKRGAARRDPVPFGLCQFGGWWMAVASGEGPAHDLTPLVGRGAGGVERGAGGVERENSGHVDVGRQPNQVSRVPDSGWPLPLSALICGPDGGKTPRNGVEKRRFLGESATWLITAQLLLKTTFMSRVGFHESQARNRRKFRIHISLRQNMAC